MGKTFRKKGEGDFWDKDKEWRNTADRKKWYKPGSTFKKHRRKSEKAKLSQPIKNGLTEETILPITKKNDLWDYN
jgi:hypothetical protein